MELSVIIPIYNEALNIPTLYERLTKVIKGMDLSYEFIFVNDGSKDESIDLIRDLAKKDSAIRYIDFSRNFGHQIAVTAGLDQSKGKAIAIIDADLQDPPELIPEMFDRLRTGYEVVYAKRKSRAGESFLKKLTARYFYRLLSKMTNVDIPVDTGDFRIVDHKVVEQLRKMPEQNKFLRGQISWIGFRQTYIEYERQQRLAGETGYTYKKMIGFALDGITAFSNFPLKLVTLSGFFVSFIAFLLVIYALVSKFILKDFEPGWTSLMLSILFLGGIQLISVGIIGEYVSRINQNVRNRPLYIIRDTNIVKKQAEEPS